MLISTVVNEPTRAVPQALAPLALVQPSVGPIKETLSLLLVVHILTKIPTAIRPIHDSAPMKSATEKLPSIALAIGPSEDTITMTETLVVVTHIALCSDVLAMPMPLSHLPLAIIEAPIRP